MAEARKKDDERVDGKKIATETISALKLVTAVDAQNVKVSSYDTFENANSLGVATTSGTVGQYVKVVTYGEVKDPFFTFPVNTQLFLGNNGDITSAPPSGASEFITRIGHSLGNGVIFIDIEPPIEIC